MNPMNSIFDRIHSDFILHAVVLITGDEIGTKDTARKHTSLCSDGRTDMWWQYFFYWNSLFPCIFSTVHTFHTCIPGCASWKEQKKRSQNSSCLHSFGEEESLHSCTFHFSDLFLLHGRNHTYVFICPILPVCQKKRSRRKKDLPRSCEEAVAGLLTCKRCFSQLTPDLSVIDGTSSWQTLHRRRTKHQESDTLSLFHGGRRFGWYLQSLLCRHRCHLPL